MGTTPKMGDFVSGTDKYHHAKFHADRCHCRRDICNRTDTFTADLMSDKRNTIVAFVDNKREGSLIKLNAGKQRTISN